MKTSFRVSSALFCGLLCAIGSMAATQQTPPALLASRPTIRHVYSRDGHLRLTVQRTATGLRVYRQVGTRTVPIR